MAVHANFTATVYTEDDYWINPKLSGVGMIASLPLTGAGIVGILPASLDLDRAPIEVAARYDDPDLDPSSLKRMWFFPNKSLSSLCRALLPPANTPVGFVNTYFACGFPFHDACWALLSALFHPGKVIYIALVIYVDRARTRGSD